MNYLFVHQSFPGQYRHIIRALASSSSNVVVGLGISQLEEALPNNVSYFRYSLSRVNTEGIDSWLIDLDSKLIRGKACAFAANKLKSKGFVPDIICAHPGWGEALFLKDIWPNTPLLSYQEFFYNPYGYDYDFDSELQGSPDWQSCARLQFKNINPLLMLNVSDWNTSPTNFQRSSFPQQWHSKISVIHDGIDTNLATPLVKRGCLRLPDGKVLSPDEQIITFANRVIEPYRGCHTFIRSIPEIQLRFPKAQIVIIGAYQGNCYGKAPHQGSWKDIFLAEIEGSYNPEFVHFVGPLGYSSFLQFLQHSSCHVYFTYPFVLSWSLLEAMSIGLPVVASSTAPVCEVIQDGVTGLLSNFFSPSSLADSIDSVLDNTSYAQTLGAYARSFVLDNYSLDKCVPRHLELINLVSSGILS